MKNKKLISKLLAVMISISAFIPVHTFASDVGVDIDGTFVPFNSFTGIPFVDENNRTQVPLRACMELYGCQVDWNSTTKTALVSKDGQIVEIPIGKPYIFVNGIKNPIDTAGRIENNRTYIPIRPVVEVFGATVEWSGKDRQVTIIPPQDWEAPQAIIDLNISSTPTGFSLREIKTRALIHPHEYEFYMTCALSLYDQYLQGEADAELTHFWESIEWNWNIESHNRTKDTIFPILVEDLDWYLQTGASEADILWETCAYIDHNEEIKLNFINNEIFNAYFDEVCQMFEEFCTFK